MILNLVYHITAVDRPLMWYNLSRLKQKLPIFNGRRVVTIAVPGHDNATKLLLGYKSQEELDVAIEQAPLIVANIKRYLGDNIIYNIVPNQLEEGTKHFFQLASSFIDASDHQSFTFYGHTKGVRYLPRTGEYYAASVWTDMLYTHVYDAFLDMFMKFHAGYNAYGAIKYEWPDNSWSYEGAFFWFRNATVFSNPTWQITSDFNKWRMEDFLPRIIPSSEAYSPFSLPDTFTHPSQLLSYGAWELYFQSQGTTLFDAIDAMNQKVETIVIPANA
jgi:hypothetical protein